LLRVRLITLAVALAAFAAVAAVAVAAPRTGYYIDPPIQVYLKTKGNKIKSFQAPCFVEAGTGGQDVQNGGFVIKGLHISKKGKFHYKGKVKLQNAGTSKVNVNIKGKIGKKATGSYEFTDPGSACHGKSFKAKYYGKNPQG
jgi:hypothetical protein